MKHVKPDLASKLNAKGTHPKKILSLDGGGLKGILTLGILQKFESELRKKYEDDTYLLADYYDLMGGTSTGAIIASALSIGMSVSKLIELYKTLGTQVFGKRGISKWTRDGFWKSIRALKKENYPSKVLEKNLNDILKDITIGDQRVLKCGLALNAKRADSYSLWTLANHPDGKYYEANKDIRLADLCRASSAAPYYFKPKKMSSKNRAGDPIEMTFIDGGVSLANNPAWQLFLVATVPSFGFKWEDGVDDLHITSFGTGKGVNRDNPDELANMRTINWASKIPELFMIDAGEMNEIILGAFGKNIGPSIEVDGQFGDMSDVRYKNHKLFSYARYNVGITTEELTELGFSFSEEKIASLKEMDHFENLDDWLAIGQRYAEGLEPEFV